MKQIALIFCVLTFSVASFADFFSCELRVNGTMSVGYAESRPGTVLVENQGYYCSASHSGGNTRVHLYEPGETDDDDATKGYGERGDAVEVKNGPAVCMCGLS